MTGRPCEIQRLISPPTMPRNVIDSSILERLDPEYVAFHNAHLLDCVPTEYRPWDPKIREEPAVPGASQPREVGSIKDFSLSKTSIRTFTPKSERPPNGWPALIWLHGGSLASKYVTTEPTNHDFKKGGWTLGNIDSESSFITQIVNCNQFYRVFVGFSLMSYSSQLCGYLCGLPPST